MYCKVQKCCFCCSLRWGIIFFAYINVVLSLLAVACLTVATEFYRSSITDEPSLEMVTSTVLFAILGMGVLMNVVLLVASYQKDLIMLKLYNYYSVGMIVAALIPTIILLTRMYLLAVSAAGFAILFQSYVIVLVRSEILKLKHQQMKRTETPPACDHIVVVPDTTTLI